MPVSTLPYFVLPSSSLDVTADLELSRKQDCYKLNPNSEAQLQIETIFIRHSGTRTPLSDLMFYM